MVKPQRNLRNQIGLRALLCLSAFKAVLYRLQENQIPGVPIRDHDVMKELIRLVRYSPERIVV